MYPIVVLGIGIASIFSLYYSERLPADLETTAAATGLGSYIGFILMTVIAAALIGTQLGSGEGSSLLSIGELFVPVLLSGLPAALVAAGTTYAKNTFTPAQ